MGSLSKTILLFEATSLSIPLILTLILLSQPSWGGWIILLSPAALYFTLGMLTPRMFPPHPWLIFFSFLGHIILMLGISLAITIAFTLLRRDASVFVLILLILGTILIIPAFLIGLFLGLAKYRQA